jgi:hypothetical protein
MPNDEVKELQEALNKIAQIAQQARSSTDEETLAGSLCDIADITEEWVEPGEDDEGEGDGDEEET